MFFSCCCKLLSIVFTLQNCTWLFTATEAWSRLERDYCHGKKKPMSVCQREDLTCCWSNIYLNSLHQPFSYGPWQAGTRSAVGQCWGHLWASVAPSFSSVSTRISSRAWWGDTSLWLAVLQLFFLIFLFYLRHFNGALCILKLDMFSISRESSCVFNWVMTTDYCHLVVLLHRCIMYELFDRPL